MHILRGWRRRAAQRRRADADALQLAGMSEHELRDLGVGRSELPELARRTWPHLDRRAG